MFWCILLQYIVVYVNAIIADIISLVQNLGYYKAKTFGLTHQTNKMIDSPELPQIIPNILPHTKIIFL